MKLSALIASASIPATLIRSTVRQIGGWEEFESRAHDVANHGASGGFHGFCYYTETEAFARRNKSAILSMATEQAAEFAEEGIISFLCGFQCLKEYSQEEIAEGLYNPRSDMLTQVYNALAWYALEEVCRAYVDLSEQGS